MLRAGMFLQNRYEILELIGSGGMSDVYKARCHKLDRLVAIKVLKTELSSDTEAVSKFQMEAQAAACLSHPNIVNVYDVVDEGNLHYIVMELIEGITLKSYIIKKGRLDYQEAVGIAIQVAQGIAAAHEQHIIHRDIKPQNMIISKDGKVKVADFGIARVVTDQTQGGVAVGSVHYISPEQAKGGHSDMRSDIYSLGITIYEMVTGRLPFEGDSTVAVALAHVEEPITRPSIYEPNIPVSLENIILKCTEKKPERRYASVTEVIADLRRVLVRPDENFVTMASDPVYDDNTVPISAEELRTLNKAHKSYQPMGGAEEEDEEDYIGDMDDDPGGNRKRGGRVRRGIDGFLTGMGILLAVLIVAVAILVLARLGGLFHSGGIQESTSSQAETTTAEEESTLAETEILAPDATNLPEDMAERKLKDYTLVMHVSEYVESETVEKGYVISQDPPEGTVVKKYSTVEVVVSSGNGRIDVSALKLANQRQEDAAALVRQQGLEVEVAEEYHDTVPAGIVIRYEPEEVKADGTVVLYVSLGRAPVMCPVPDLYNISEEEARQRLEEAGLNPGEVTHAFDDTIPEGCVISQSVEANVVLEEGSQVSFVVSDGPEVKPEPRRIAAISESFDLETLLGPGAAGATLRVELRLRQDGEDGSQYKTLMDAVELTGGVRLPIEYNAIEAIVPEAEYGEIEVVNADTGEVLKAYPIRFFEIPE